MRWWLAIDDQGAPRPPPTHDGADDRYFVHLRCIGGSWLVERIWQNIASAQASIGPALPRGRSRFAERAQPMIDEVLEAVGDQIGIRMDGVA